MPPARHSVLPQDKQKLTTGKALIKYFCTPCAKTITNGGRTRNLPEHDPAKWELFVEYNRQDVVTEMEIEHRLSRFPVPERVQREWEYDMRISARGVAADRELVDGALYCGTAIEEAAKQEAIELTGLENPKSRDQMLTWLQGHGVAIPDLRSATVEDALEHKDEYEPDVARVLELRQLLSKASIKKYSTVITTMCEDGRIRGLLQFYGANRTGRWAGRLVQVQNLPRTYLHGAMLDTARDLTRRKLPEGLELLYGSVPGTLSLVRTALVPRPGYKFVDADFSAIEARVVAWLAGVGSGSCRYSARTARSTRQPQVRCSACRSTALLRATPSTPCGKGNRHAGVRYQGRQFGADCHGRTQERPDRGRTARHREPLAAGKPCNRALLEGGRKAAAIQAVETGRPRYAWPSVRSGGGHRQRSGLFDYPAAVRTQAVLRAAAFRRQPVGRQTAAVLRHESDDKKVECN